MNRYDFNLIHSFIDTKNPKPELNYALVMQDGICATDTQKAIKYHILMLDCSGVLASKKIVKCVASMMGKDDTASIGADGVVYISQGDKISLDNRDVDFKYPDIHRVLDEKLQYVFELDDISDLHFELTQKECFIDDVHLNPIIEYGGCSKYVISYNKQEVTADTTNTGRVKIVGIHNVDDEVDAVKFTAMIMGREFKTQAKEQLLLDL